MCDCFGHWKTHKFWSAAQPTENSVFGQIIEKSSLRLVEDTTATLRKTCASQSLLTVPSLAISFNSPTMASIVAVVSARTGGGPRFRSRSLSPSRPNEAGWQERKRVCFRTAVEEAKQHHNALLTALDSKSYASDAVVGSSSPSFAPLQQEQQQQQPVVVEESDLLPSNPVARCEALCVRYAKYGKLQDFHDFVFTLTVVVATSATLKSSASVNLGRSLASDSKTWSALCVHFLSHNVNELKDITSWLLKPLITESHSEDVVKLLTSLWNTPNLVSTCLSSTQTKNELVSWLATVVLPSLCADATDHIRTRLDDLSQIHNACKETKHDAGVKSLDEVVRRLDAAAFDNFNRWVRTKNRSGPLPHADRLDVWFDKRAAQAIRDATASQTSEASSLPSTLLDTLFVEGDVLKCMKLLSAVIDNDADAPYLLLCCKRALKMTTLQSLQDEVHALPSPNSLLALYTHAILHNSTTESRTPATERTTLAGYVRSFCIRVQTLGPQTVLSGWVQCLQRELMQLVESDFTDEVTHVESKEIEATEAPGAAAQSLSGVAGVRLSSGKVIMLSEAPIPILTAAQEWEKRKTDFATAKKKAQKLLADATKAAAEAKEAAEAKVSSSSTAATSVAPTTVAKPLPIVPTFQTSYTMDTVMQLVGLENIKREFLRVWDYVDLQRRRGVTLTRDRFHVRLVGGSGTGKTTVARLYTQFLLDLNITETQNTIFHGQRVVDKGADDGWVKPVQQLFGRINSASIIIDEAGCLDPSTNPGGRSVVHAISADVEEKRHELVLVFIGRGKDLDGVFGSNVTLNSQVSMRWVFEDYNQAELKLLFEKELYKRDSRFEVTGGMNGPALQILSRRLAARRGPDFDNAHAVSNLVDQILRRQATRLRRVKRSKLLTMTSSVNNSGESDSDSDNESKSSDKSKSGEDSKSADDESEDAIDWRFELTFDDVIGPNPFTALETSAAYKQLMGMVGLKQVKREIQQLIHAVRENYQRELRLQEKADLSLNRVFYGSPGTGKTSVAKLWGQIFCDLGVLSKGEFHLRGVSDLIGAALGESEKKANAVLQSSKGGVLAIDEAYGLDQGRQSDPYRKAVIDAIVEKVQPSGDADRVVLLLGYKDPMEAMFRSCNPGLARRFDATNPIMFEDYNDQELLQILTDYLRGKNIEATIPALLRATDCLSKKRRLPNFGNAGEVHNLVNAAVARFMRRTREDPQSCQKLLPEDFENPNTSAPESLEDIFRPMIGCSAILERMRNMHAVIQRKKARGLDYINAVPVNWIFRGPPGTGKSSTAALMGRVYYSLDILASPEVVTVSAAKLQAGFVGQTASRVRETFRSALGKVLFIDEAYRLDPKQSPHSFMKEAVDEIVNMCTEDEFKGKLVVIMAGYTREMHQMLQSNEGLSSRFPDELDFPAFNVDDSLQLLQTVVAQMQYTLDDPTVQHQQTRSLMAQIAALPSFASGRDVHTLASRIDGALAMKDLPTQAAVPIDVVHDVLDNFLQDSQTRNRHATEARESSLSQSSSIEDLFRKATEDMRAPILDIAMKKAHQHTPKRSQGDDSETSSCDDDTDSSDSEAVAPRDPGVSDAVWEKVQTLIKAEQSQKSQTVREEVRIEHGLGTLQQQLQCALAQGDNDAASAIRVQIAEEQAKLLRIRDDKQKLVDIQKKLATAGVCPAGFNWVRDGNFWRCSGGAHTISDEQLGRM